MIVRCKGWITRHDPEIVLREIEGEGISDGMCDACVTAVEASFNERCPECVHYLRGEVPAGFAWVSQRGGGDGYRHCAKRGPITAAVDAAPHFMTMCGLSLGAMS